MCAYLSQLILNLLILIILAWISFFLLLSSPFANSVCLTNFPLTLTNMFVLPLLPLAFFNPPHTQTPGYLGLFCALTGLRLTYSDMMYAGLATHYVPSTQLPELLGKLRENSYGSSEALEEEVKRFSANPTEESKVHAR